MNKKISKKQIRDVIVGVQLRKGGYSPYFKIGNQTFSLTPVPTNKLAKWYAGQLYIALSKRYSIEYIQRWLHEEQEKIDKKSVKEFPKLDLNDRMMLEIGIGYTFDFIQGKTHKGRL